MCFEIPFKRSFLITYLKENVLFAKTWQTLFASRTRITNHLCTESPLKWNNPQKMKTYKFTFLMAKKKHRNAIKDKNSHSSTSSFSPT